MTAKTSDLWLDVQNISDEADIVWVDARDLATAPSGGAGAGVRFQLDPAPRPFDLTFRFPASNTDSVK